MNRDGQSLSTSCHAISARPTTRPARNDLMNSALWMPVGQRDALQFEIGFHPLLPKFTTEP